MLEHDRRLREISSFTPGEYVFLENPTLRLAIDASEETMAKQAYSNHQARASRPYRIKSIQKNTETIYDICNPQIVSTGYAAYAAFLFSHELHKSHDSANQNVSSLRDRKDRQDAVRDNAYDVEEIVGRIEQAPDINDVVRRYGCSVAHDTLEPPEQISRSFINRYRQTKQRKKKN